METYTIVDRVSACQSAVEKLERETSIAVDTEGVHLSKTGPLTLVQIATSRGRVFLFDVMREPRMFEDGGLKRLLENEGIVKVLHSGRNDAQALHYQFGVGLKRVHDTQVAHRVLQMAEGLRFPPRARLADVCAIYCPEKLSLVDEEKDLISEKMNRTEGEYWAKRPLTREMINYAASDVVALIPEMYMDQKQLLKDKGLIRTFETRVEEDLRRVVDPEFNEKLWETDRNAASAFLKDFARTAPRGLHFRDITDENVLEALSMVRISEIPDLGLPSLIRDLKLQDIQLKLDEIESNLEEQGSNYNAHGACKRLHAFVSFLEDGPMKEKAQRLQKRINVIILRDMQTKYTASTPVLHMAHYEKTLLTRELRPKGERDSSVHPVLLKLYWKVKLADLEEKIESFNKDSINFKIHEGFVKMLKFYVSGEVPSTIKRLGKDFLVTLQDMGKVAPPQRSGGGRQGNGRGSARGYRR